MNKIELTKDIVSIRCISHCAQIRVNPEGGIQTVLKDTVIDVPEDVAYRIKKGEKVVRKGWEIVHKAPMKKAGLNLPGPGTVTGDPSLLTDEEKEEAAAAKEKEEADAKKLDAQKGDKKKGLEFPQE